MKSFIQSIELNNYRQYYGTQKIDFTYQQDKNVCLVHGRNGAGKSNFLNAITWCLYGIEAHKQNDKATPDSMPLINTRALEELRPGQTVAAEVTILLSADGRPWSITRSREIGKSALGFMEKSYTDKIRVIYEENGQNKVIDTPDAQVLINNILPEALRSFFFIDGEQLREFFKVSSPRKIAAAIDQVSQLDILYRVAASLDLSEKKLRKSARSNNPKVQELEKRLELIENNITKSQTGIIDFEQKKDDLEGEKILVDDYLQNYSHKNISRLAQERDLVKKDISALDNDIAVDVADRNAFLVDKAPFIYLKDTIEASYDIIQSKVERGVLPPPIRENLIGELLEKGECICGTQLNEETRQNLTEYAKSLQYSEYAEKGVEGKYALTTILNDIKKFPEMIDEKNAKIDKLMERREEKIRREIQIGEEIEGYNIDEIKLKEQRLKELNSSISHYGLKVLGLQEELKRLFEMKEKLKEEWESETRKEKEFEKIKIKLKFVQDAKKILSNTESIIKGKIRTQVETNTKKNFMTLIRKKNAFSDIDIDDSYQVRISHVNGYNAINDLSAGEYMILGLSFMSSLMTISGFQAPVIIDTPLGKIDDEHRDYITNELPKFLRGTQLMLLVTPTEYDQHVEHNLNAFLLPSNNYKIVEDGENTQSELISYGN
ncbi:hypothetical protein AZH53_09800 [Methanomicrobiaceae archaeon CYW5]|uniref:AAA family ATPase n=1 Tax=Methanovulcanius yangii TaxID=1789227 RepID=UPI0029CA5B07|nr:AAA family ATPase [Methanovulcanius yangii]MBT8508697.1 hypothetical protein [Methanovulcanius yangii]